MPSRSHFPQGSVLHSKQNENKEMGFRYPQRVYLYGLPNNSAPSNELFYSSSVSLFNLNLMFKACICFYKICNKSGGKYLYGYLVEFKGYSCLTYSRSPKQKFSLINSNICIHIFNFNIWIQKNEIQISSDSLTFICKSPKGGVFPSVNKNYNVFDMYIPEMMLAYHPVLSLCLKYQRIYHANAKRTVQHSIESYDT